ncbi:nucleotidyltransferase [Halobacillus yeomjeoni]|uniref:nucleotidyltransferase n=1 Tax=Halobacillus yeomjeoni TaxID=311194 RepID=UPI001CD76B5D|nr:nucleotidyltransferase [Halobacillus yeomjeoni]MCA0983585.1 nucleotidyltransferase [Halobacillus yeomjeoni]
MKACGVIVEYNPFHNGHAYHIEQSKKQSGAECMIAIMSGPFLQRGEPAIIDKWHRAEAALHSGADLVLELPYIFAVEHSDFFSQGSVQTLAEVGVDAICFGSESGSIEGFNSAYEHLQEHSGIYDEVLRKHLNEGLSFPEASRLGYEAIKLPSDSIDLTQPNNILGYSYVKQIRAYTNDVEPMTIKRQNNHYHDETITGKVASATSIRKQLMTDNEIKTDVKEAIPSITQEMLNTYREKIGIWHDWELYFPFLQFKVLTMIEEDLRQIHGVDEGLEHRLKRTIKEATSFQEFMSELKTKRYTWTRLQRTLVHILIGTSKEDAGRMLRQPAPPYARILGMTDHGKRYLRHQKKAMDIPLITQPQQLDHPMLDLEERAAAAYYAVTDPKMKVERMKREFGPPIQV